MRYLYAVILIFYMSACYADTKYFAEIDINNAVKRVIVADSIDWCEQALGGRWIETFMDNPGKNYAGRGHDYFQIFEDFVSPQPFTSWLLDEKHKWKAPVDIPKDGKMYKWNESLLKWQ